MAFSKSEQPSATSDLAAGVREFILKRFPRARKDRIEDSDPLLETGVLDSLGVLDVVAFIEQEYSINVCDDDLVPENFQSIQRIATFVQSKVKA